ncbi:MAG: hypothetical protein ABF453_01980 [Bifidobacterium psychraerophilum]|uniref:hypothetical protein n=1 Tax=Bifidobacterium psychraerophilum TaxID=218140 RepID=UPI0039EB628F
MMIFSVDSARSRSRGRKPSVDKTGRPRGDRRNKALTTVPWALLVLLWLFAGVVAISTANSNYRVFGDVVINALGSGSFDIMVSGSSDPEWSPDVSGTVSWEQGKDAPYVIDVPESPELLIPGTVVWTSVAVKNVSFASSAGIQVTLMDAQRSDPRLNLFEQSQFTLECDGAVLFSDVPGDEAWRMAKKGIGRILAPDDAALCHVGVSLRREILDKGYAIPRNARVIPQLLFEGVQR